MAFWESWSLKNWKKTVEKNREFFMKTTQRHGLSTTKNQARTAHVYMQGGNEATDLDIAMLLGDSVQLTQVIFSFQGDHIRLRGSTPFEHQYHE